jgi:hypothetical protein
MKIGKGTGDVWLQRLQSSGDRGRLRQGDTENVVRILEAFQKTLVDVRIEYV